MPTTTTQLSRRDLFAASALAGLLANPRLFTDVGGAICMRTSHTREAFAISIAAQAADRLIAELDRKGDSK